MAIPEQPRAAAAPTPKKRAKAPPKNRGTKHPARNSMLPEAASTTAEQTVAVGTSEVYLGTEQGAAVLLGNKDSSSVLSEGKVGIVQGDREVPIAQYTYASPMSHWVRSRASRANQSGW